MKLYQRHENDPAPYGQADPYILKGGDGRYYVYATGGPSVELFSSDELLSGWRYDGHCLDAPGQHTFWAPSVARLDDGKYYMYYSSVRAGEEYDDHAQTMRVAVSETPGGPFRYVKDLLPPFSIDSHIVKTPSGLYLFYSVNRYSGGRVGTYIVCDRMLDPLTPEGRPEPVVVPTLDQEIFKRDRFKPGEDWHTIEGAYYFYHGGVHFVMYSGAAYGNDTYFVGYATADGPEDADLRRLTWVKYPDPDTWRPLLRSNDQIEGMGHNSVIFEGEKCYIVYHGRDVGFTAPGGADARCARIDEMEIKGKELSVTPTV